MSTVIGAKMPHSTSSGAFMKYLIVFALALLSASCSHTTVNGSSSYNPTQPSQPSQSVVQFRVTGTLTSARILYTDPLDGTVQVITSLPYVAQVTANTNELFLALDVTPLNYSFASASPFVSAQIFVNNVLFREAIDTSGSFNTLSVSGTWRQ